MAYERTPEGMLEALEVVSRMDVYDQIKYFGLGKNIKSCVDGLWMVVATTDAETIFENVDRYYKDKEIEKEIQTRAKVKNLVEDVGLHNVLTIAREMLMKQDEGRVEK